MCVRVCVISKWCQISSIYIGVAAVEQVSSFKFLGIHISNDLIWSANSSTLVKKAQLHLYFLRSLSKAHLCPR